MYELVTPGYVVIRLPRFSMPWGMIGLSNPLLPSLCDCVKNLDCDVVHAYSHLFLTSALAVKGCKASKKPSVVSVHGVMALRSLLVNFLQRTYISTVGLWTLKNSTKVICLTKADAREIVKFGVDSHKIAVIPNAINVQNFNAKGDENFVLWAGRFVPEKGPQYLIKAAEIALKYRPNLRFSLVGDGPLKPAMMQMVAEHGLSKAINFLGVMNQGELSKIMGKCSIVVLSSFKEGFPRVLLEAMACEKPVVVFDIPGVNELIQNEKNGIVVQLRDSRSMAQAIIRLFDDEDLRVKLGRIGRRLVLENYNWDVVIEKIEKLYHEAIKENE
jgi:glycosyltransferase involved in cell wall biosynthesis